MSGWLPALVRRLEREEAVVRVVVSAVRGSTPRERGAWMLVGSTIVDGTIGGGHLEWKALEIARGMLEAATDAGPRRDRFVLGATLGQCCGGVVELTFERIAAAQLELHRKALAERVDTSLAPLWLFGAGHVGQAIVRVLADLPFHVTWVDERGDIFPASIPDHVTQLVSDDPAGEVTGAPPGAIYLVLTHRHDLDFELCRAILARDDVRWAGVIGSATKAASFRNRLARLGIERERIARLVSPIGIDGIASKVPAAIAVAVAAQLLQVNSAAAHERLPSAAAR
jgi:xanthine dehydrogenase accessory factor